MFEVAAAVALVILLVSVAELRKDLEQLRRFVHAISALQDKHIQETKESHHGG